MTVLALPLVVEDGSGLADADAYVSVDFLRQYCANFGYALDETLADAQLGANVRRATAWIDTAFRYKGAKTSGSQMLEFPRTGLIDWSSKPVTGMPARVMKACAELAYKATLDIDLFQDLERGGMIASKTTGPLTTSWAPGAPAQKVYAQAQGFLEQYIRSMDYLLTAPQAKALDCPDAPYFTLDVLSNPYTASGFDNDPEELLS